MKSRTSFFNPAVLRKDITRFAPLWGMYLVAVENILAVPVSLPEEDGSWMAELAPGMVYIAPSTGQPVAPVLWAMGMIVSAFGIGIWYESWHKRKKR